MASQQMNITIKAFDKTAKGLGSAAKGIKAVAGSVLNLKTALIGVAGVAGFGLVIKSSMATTDALGKTARKIGVTTEALAKMRYAASLTGVSTETMDMALQRFTRRAAEAARGTGEAKDALRELNIDANSLIKMPLEQQMGELADAFETLGSDADRVRVAMKLFDSEGVALVNTLGVGKDALALMAQEADELGLALSGTAVKGVEDANDAFSKLGFLFKGVRDQTVAALAPALEKLANFLTTTFKNAITDANGSVADFAHKLALNIIEAFESVTKGLLSVLNAVGSTAHEIKSIYRSLFSSADTKKNELELQKLEQAAYKAGISLSQALDPDSNYVDRLSESNQQIVQDINRIQGAINAIKNEESEPFVPFTFTALLESFDVMKEGLKESREELKDDFIGPLQEDFELAFEGIKNTIDVASLSIAQTSYNALGSVLGSMQGILGSLMSATEKGSKEYKALFAISKGVAVAQAIVGANLAGVSTLAAYAAASPQVALGGPAALLAWNAKGAAMASLVTGLGYANAAIIAATAVKSFDGGGFTGAGSRSGGVDGKGGFPAILHPNETVIDHTRGQSVGGEAIVINQTFNVSTGVASTVRSEIANLMPQIAEATTNAVAQNRMRGGAYSRQLLGR